MRLYILHLGNCRVDKGSVLTPGLDKGTWWTIPIPGYLIQTDDGRNILVDTGMDRSHIANPGATFGETAFGDVLKVEMTESDYVVNRLAELGLTPEDIDILVATHFHFDHAGNTRDFSGSEIVVQKDCYDDIRRPDARYPRDTYDIPGLSWRIVDGDVEIAPASSGSTPCTCETISNGTTGEPIGTRIRPGQAPAACRNWQSNRERSCSRAMIPCNGRRSRHPPNTTVRSVAPAQEHPAPLPEPSESSAAFVFLLT